MKIKPDFNLKDVCGVNVVVAEGEQNIDFDSIFSLNDTGAFLWKEAQKGDFTISSLAHALTEEYEVDNDTAQKDISAFIDKLKEQHLIDE